MPEQAMHAKKDVLHMSWHGYIVSAQSRSTYLPSYVVLGIPYESPNWEQFTFGPLRLKCYFFQFLNGSLNMKQLYILSIKPKLDMGLFVDFCVFTWIWLNLPDQNLKLFLFFMFRTMLCSDQANSVKFRWRNRNHWKIAFQDLV